MTVRTLIDKLQKCNPDSTIIFDVECIGTTLDCGIQTNDGDDNSPVFIELQIPNHNICSTALESVTYMKGD